MSCTRACSEQVKAWVTADDAMPPEDEDFFSFFFFLKGRFHSRFGANKRGVCRKREMKAGTKWTRSLRLPTHAQESKGAKKLILISPDPAAPFNKRTPFACKSDQLPASSWDASIISHRAISCLICLALKHKLLCTAERTVTLCVHSTLI